MFVFKQSFNGGFVIEHSDYGSYEWLLDKSCKEETVQELTAQLNALHRLITELDYDGALGDTGLVLCDLEFTHDGMGMPVPRSSEELKALIESAYSESLWESHNPTIRVGELEFIVDTVRLNPVTGNLVFNGNIETPYSNIEFLD